MKKLWKSRRKKECHVGTMHAPRTGGFVKVSVWTVMVEREHVFLYSDNDINAWPIDDPDRMNDLKKFGEAIVEAASTAIEELKQRGE